MNSVRRIVGSNSPVEISSSNLLLSTNLRSLTYWTLILICVLSLIGLKPWTPNSEDVGSNPTGRANNNMSVEITCNSSREFPVNGRKEE